MSNLNKLTSNLLLMAVVVFGLMSFIIITQSQNDAPDPLINNSLINATYSDLYGNLSDSQGEGQKASDTFGQINPNEDFGVWDTNSVISPTRIFKGMGVGVWNIMIKLPIIVLGVSPIVASVISTLFLLMFILAIWAVWKGVLSTRN